MTGAGWLRNAIVLSFVTVAFCYQYTKKEEDCMLLNQLYHKESDKCFDVLSKEPCAAGEWFVLQIPSEKDRENVIKGTCVKDKCGSGKYYWPSTKQCVTKDDQQKLCGSSSTVLLGYNDFGDGDCICVKSPPHARLNGELNNPCVPLFRKGPCPNGKIVGFPTPDALVPVCMDDPCFAESREKKATGKLARNATLAQYQGKCYELNTQGPCPDDMVFQIHGDILRPGCVTLVNQIFIVGKQDECVTYIHDDCPDVVKVNINSSKLMYRRKMIEAIRLRRRKQ